jgi:Ca-activated chloride channel family protein
VSFHSPWWLLGLLLLPAAVAAYVFLQRSRERTAERFAAAGLFPNLVARSPGWRRHLPAAIGLLALTALLVGLARPHATVSVRREEATVVLAIDVSRSMAAKDVQPTRLAAAQSAARAFLAHVPSKYRTALVSFSTKAQVVTPPTRSRALVDAGLSSLRPGEGTALGDAIALAVRAGRLVPPTAGKPPPVSILLISDGKQDGGDLTPAEGAARARSFGIPVYTVALGTENGIVEVPRVGGYVERIRVPPDPTTLKQVAAATHGRFFAAPSQQELQAVYRDLASRLGSEKKDEEMTFAFAAGGLVLMLVGGALSALWFRRLP